MRLWRVEVYEQMYYRSLYRPIWREPRLPERPTADEDVVIFLGKVIDCEEVVGSSLWVPDVPFGSPEVPGAEFNYAGYESWGALMDEILRKEYYAAHPIAPEMWIAYREAWRNWTLSTTKTMAEWEAVRVLWSRTWGSLHESDRKYWAARMFWEQIRSSRAWIEVEKSLYEKYAGQVGAGPAARSLSRAGADYYMREYVRGKMSVAEIKRLIHMGRLERYLHGILSGILKWGYALFLKFWLVGVAVFALGMLLVNPDKEGLRRKWYRGSRWIVGRGDILFWADIIARTPEGRSVYMVCDRIKGRVVRTYRRGVMGTGCSEEVDLIPDAEGEVKIGWWWVLEWPWSFVGTFRGYMRPLSRGCYVLQDGFRDFDCEPWEPYKDVYGRVRFRKAEWWVWEAGSGCQKPAGSWCEEVKLDWIV